MDDPTAAPLSPAVKDFNNQSYAARQYQRIIVALFGKIGDVVLSTALLETLRTAFPQAHIAYLVGSTAAPVLENLLLIDELLVLPDHRGAGRLEDIRVFLNIAEGRFDLAVCLSRSRKLALEFWLARVPTRVGYLPTGFSWMLTDLVDSETLSELHRTDYFLAAARKLRIATLSPVRLHYQVTPAERTEARTLLENAGAHPGREILVALYPGGSPILQEKRRWGVEKFVKVARHVAQAGHRVILLGGPEERGIYDLFQRELPGKLIDLTNGLGLRELAAVLEQCSVLVTNDSSPLHLAGAVGTPVLGVFGYTDVRHWGPIGPHDRVVRRDIPCSPCLPEFPCPYSFECIRKLEPDVVIRELDAMLGRLQSRKVSV